MLLHRMTCVYVVTQKNMCLCFYTEGHVFMLLQRRTCVYVVLHRLTCVYVVTQSVLVPTWCFNIKHLNSCHSAVVLTPFQIITILNKPNVSTWSCIQIKNVF